MPASPDDVDVLVIGAGPAGLAAAEGAALNRGRVLVVERADRVGGMAASIEVAGQRVDMGSHRLHPAADPSVLERLASLLGDDLQVRRRHGRLRLADRWVAFPLQPADLVRRLPPSLAARFLLDTVGAPFRHEDHDTFGEVVRAGLGSTALTEFYGPYARKLWDVDPDELAGELARRRVSAAARGDLVQRLLRRGDSPGRVFLYPRRGFGQISEALAEEARGAGAEVRLAVDVRSISRRAPGEGFAVGLGDGSTVHAAHVWSTAPLASLVRLVDPPAPPAVREANAGVRHRGVVLVYLALDRPSYTPFDAHYFPAQHNPVARLSEPKNYRSSADDPTDRTVLCAEVPCTVGDPLWDASDAEIGRLVAEVLANEDLPPCSPTEVVTVRLPHVYPVYRVGFERSLGELERWAASTGVVTFGRQGLFTPDNTHHALAMGWAAADALAPDGTFDWARWEQARDGFRSFVVED